MSRMRRPSLLGALLWIGFGVLLLLQNFGVGLDFWSLARRYWPVLLILFGLAKVVDYFIQKDAVAIRFGEIFAILMLLIVGTAISGVSRSPMSRIFRDMPFEIGDVSMRPGQWIGNSHTYSEEATYPFERSMPIRIENSNGSVAISPGGDREIRVRLKKVIYGSESRTSEIANEIHLEAAPERKGESTAPLKPEAEPGKESGAGFFVVRTNRDSLSSRNYMFSTDMEILVPKNSQVQVQNSFGEVRVAEINGNLDLSTTHRDLEVRDCTGQFKISTRFAESRLTNLVGNVNLNSQSRGRAYLENIKGDVVVTSEYSPLEISGVDGKVSISSTEGLIRIERIDKAVVIDARGARVQAGNLKDGLKVNASNGSVDISDVASDVTVESRYATLTLKDIKGNIDIRSNSDRVSADNIRGRFQLKAQGSEVRVNGISGPLDIQTTLKDVIVNDFADACTIANEYAAVSLSTQSLGKGDVNVKDRNGDVDVFLPEGASFWIDAVARNGNVESDYSGLEPTRNANGGMLKSKAKAGGPKIMLETDYSNIHIYPTREGKPAQNKNDVEESAKCIGMPEVERWPMVRAGVTP